VKARFGSRPGAAAVALAALILLQLAAARVFLSAGADGVWFAGAPIGGACFLRQRAGVPCPTCGMTRSVVLALHGDLAPALEINPAGPVWLLAAFVLSAGLLLVAWRPGERTKRRVRSVALVQGFAFAVTLAGHWVYVVLK
jgi:hypothetical protein